MLVAAIAVQHPHHQSSADLFLTSEAASLVVAAHSYAEAYSTLTRRGDAAPVGMNPDEAIAALEELCVPLVLAGLTPAQSVAAVRSFAQTGGVGARLYDRLIGEVALVHAIPAIVTINVRHFASLFATLRIVTPEQYVAQSR